MDSSVPFVTIYCRRCGYALIGLSEHRCPECGRRFDPADARTVARSVRWWRIRRWARRAAIAAGCAVGAVTLTAGVTLGVLYWQWKAEQRIIASLERPGCHVTATPLQEPWQREVFRVLFDNGLPWHESGWAGTVFVRLTERASSIEYVDTEVSREDLARLARLRGAAVREIRQ